MTTAVRLLGAWSVVFLMGLPPAVAGTTARTPPLPPGASHVPGEVIVGLRNRGRLVSPLSQARALARRTGGRVSRMSGGTRTAVIKAAAATDVAGLARRLSASPDVRFAEPNYVFRAAGAVAGVSSVASPPPYVVRRTGTAGKAAVPKAALRAMKVRSGATVKATYPTDKLLWDNGGWDWVGASIVWNNPTPSRNVCVVDTGVDYTHPDLAGRVVKGWDCVSEDADPMDDHGHGTLVAGIIAARQNNAEGIAGVSPTAKVIAMKALNADGWGSSYDIAQAIGKCADRADVSVINLSFGGPYSVLQRDAIARATLGKGKLVVAPAGNEASDAPYCSPETVASATGDAGNPQDALRAGVRSYPAGFATASPRYSWDGSACVPAPGAELHGANTSVLSVAAGGGGEDFDYGCRAEYSNFGDWVTMAAPGTDILSTTPWDKPVTMNEEGLAPRYDYLSGSSMAAAFVSGVAARAWGYLATTPMSDATNAGVAAYVKAAGFELLADDSCWPSSMTGATEASAAAVLNRGALTAGAFDAVTGLPLIGATVQALQGSPPVVRASAVLTASKATSPDAPPGYLTFPSTVDLINIPVFAEPPHLSTLDPLLTTLRVGKSGYTATPANAFVAGDGYIDGTTEVPWGWWGYGGYAAVPPRNARFTAVSAWDLWEERATPWLTTQLPPSVDASRKDFVVGHSVCDDTSLEGDHGGELSVFPFAQASYFSHDATGTPEVGDNFLETHQIGNRSQSGYPALPQYAGEYVFRVFDPGRAPDHQAEFETRQGSLLIWKDGYLKGRVDLDLFDADDPGCGADTPWWEAARLVSGPSGAATIVPINKCRTTGFLYAPGSGYPAACVPAP